MAARSDNWVWKHVLKSDDFTVRCNIRNCNKTYSTKHTRKWIKALKTHLYYKHKIWTEEDRSKWENDNNFLWQYFDKVDLYKGKCKFCKVSYHEIYLMDHLRIKHNEEIRAAIQKETNKSLSQYFEIREKQFSARCKSCHRSINILNGTDILIRHNCLEKHLIFQQKPENNNMNRMTQQSIAKENSDTNSHHNNINIQTIGNRENQLSNTSRYCVGVMAALEGSDNWIWEHLFKLDNSHTQCKWCYNIYKLNHHTHTETVIIIKEHLYYQHEKYNEEDRLKWENDHDFIWRYFDKTKLYIAKCKFCNISLKCLHKPYLRIHLKTHHWKELQDTIGKEIANYLPHIHFAINIATLTASCYHCNYTVNIFYTNTGIDDLSSHCQYHRNENSRYEEAAADNSEYRIMQQDIAAENMTTRYHHESTYCQHFENQKDQQR